MGGMNTLLAIDDYLIRMVDDFCIGLQTKYRVHYAWMMTGIAFGTCIMAVSASILMSRGWGAAQLVWPILWGAAVFGMVHFLRTSLWKDVRSWPARRDHWVLMATMMRRNGRPMRAFGAGGIVLFFLLNAPFLIVGDRGLAMMSFKFLFVSMVPIMLLMYAFCAMPASLPGEKT